MKLIKDWFDFGCIIGLDFFIIVVGVWILPQLLEKVHLSFSLAILCSACYFSKKLIEFLIEKFNKLKEKNHRFSPEVKQ